MAAIVATVAALPLERSLSTGGNVAYARSMGATPNDSALMLRYKDGDVAAFEILYRRHNDSLYRYLLRLSLNRDTAEDVFQEVWGKIIKARHRYRPTAKFTTFLYRVAQPDEQRDAFLLHEEAGLSIDTIAQVTGVNRETVKSRLRYATKKLKAALAEPAVQTQRTA